MHPLFQTLATKSVTVADACAVLVRMLLCDFVNLLEEALHLSFEKLNQLLVHLSIDIVLDAELFR